MDTPQNDQAALDAKLTELTERAEETHRQVVEMNNASRGALDGIEAQVDASIVTVEGIYADLDQVEKEVGDELDTHLLQRAEGLAREE